MSLSLSLPFFLLPPFFPFSYLLHFHNHIIHVLNHETCHSIPSSLFFSISLENHFLLLVCASLLLSLVQYQTISFYTCLLTYLELSPLPHPPPPSPPPPTNSLSQLHHIIATAPCFHFNNTYSHTLLVFFRESCTCNLQA